MQRNKDAGCTRIGLDSNDPPVFRLDICSTMRAESTYNETVLVGKRPCFYCVPAAQRMRKIDHITSTWDARDIIANRVRDGICRVCLHWPIAGSNTDQFIMQASLILNWRWRKQIGSAQSSFRLCYDESRPCALLPGQYDGCMCVGTSIQVHECELHFFKWENRTEQAVRGHPWSHAWDSDKFRCFQAVRASITVRMIRDVDKKNRAKRHLKVFHSLISLANGKVKKWKSAGDRPYGDVRIYDDQARLSFLWRLRSSLDQHHDAKTMHLQGCDHVDEE